MSVLKGIQTVGVCGAGSMGAGIAQVAAQSGHNVVVFDNSEKALTTGRQNVTANLERLKQKKKINSEGCELILSRLSWSQELESLKKCDLVIEAIIEDLDVKLSLFRAVEEIVSANTIIATNTSSLPVSRLASHLNKPDRFLGLHFFNPAQIMKLVEIIPGLSTDKAIVEILVQLIQDWGKTPVASRDVPGFIVNRVARPFYAEGWKAFEEGVAPAATIDYLMRSCGSFRMGPLELGDLIGHDINSTAAQSIFESYFGRTRFHPSVLQKQYADSGRLGRKTGIGVYNYRTDDPKKIEFRGAAKAGRIIAGPKLDKYPKINNENDFQSRFPSGFWEADDVLVGFTDGRSARSMKGQYLQPVAVIDYAVNFELTDCLAYSVSCESADKPARAVISALGKKPVRIDDRPGALVFRTLLQLVNAASDAARDQVASGSDVDIAMLKGVNYPVGPLSWAREFGAVQVRKALEYIAKETGEWDLYNPGAHLERFI